MYSAVDTRCYVRQGRKPAPGLRAVPQGDADAQNFLGLMYSNGRGVPQDYALAFRLAVLQSRYGPRMELTPIEHQYDPNRRDDQRHWMDEPCQQGRGKVIGPQAAIEMCRGQGNQADDPFAPRDAGVVHLTRRLHRPNLDGAIGQPANRPREFEECCDCSRRRFPRILWDLDLIPASL